MTRDAVLLLGGLATLSWTAWLWGDGVDGWPTWLLLAAGVIAFVTGLSI